MQRLITFFHTLDWDSPLGSAMVVMLAVPGVMLFYLMGPTLLLAYGLQRWATGSSWDWKDRWASVRGAAVFCGLIWLLLCTLLILHVPFFLHTLHSLWQHIPLLGAFSLWPPLLATTVARWLLPLPLTPLLALGFEHFSPLTSPGFTRVLQPHEQAQIQRQQAEAAAQAAAQESARQAAAQAAASEATAQLKRKRANSATQEQPKRAKRQLYAQRKRPPQPINSPLPENTNDEGTQEEPRPSTPASPPTPPAKPKIDWSRVEE